MTDRIETAVLRELWYLACPARDLKPGSVLHKEIAGEPVLLARGRDGDAFALRDICPHRGIPLSHGRLYGGNDVVDSKPLGENQIECCYHGWRFGSDGRCRAIPSLVSGQQVDLSKIRVRSFPLVERQGLIWVYIPETYADAGEPGVRDADFDNEPLMPAPEIPGVGDRAPGLIIQQVFETDLDQAVIGLMDPAHGPYVHKAPWWRNPGKIQEKAKHFARAPLGFVMTAHTPSSNSFVYKLLGGDITTEITFSLPSLRTELIRSNRGAICGVTHATPIGPCKTEVTQMFFWTMPWVGIVAPIVGLLGQHFLGQDRRIMALQQEGLRYNPRVLLIKDADTLTQWYFRMKKAWLQGLEEGTPFHNPVPEEVTLRWRT